MRSQPTIGATDEEIFEGLRHCDPQMTCDYFYGYSRIAYHIYDGQYGLQWKPGLDFYSIAHEYYLLLDKYDFRQLKDRRAGMSLKTWMVGGFRFVLLDRLKAFQKEHLVQSFEERMGKDNVNFDIPNHNFSEDFRNTVFEICQNIYGLDAKASVIFQMLLIDGFKSKEVAMQLGLTPSAVTQRFHKIRRCRADRRPSSRMLMPSSPTPASIPSRPSLSHPSGVASSASRPMR